MKKVKFLLDCSLASHGSVKAGTEMEMDNAQAESLEELGAVEIASGSKKKAKLEAPEAPLDPAA